MSAILIAQNLSYGLPNGRELFGGLSFSLDARISALVGPNGVGKTSLARLLVGELEPTQGVIRRSTTVSFLPQRQTPERITVAEFLADHSEWSLLRDRLLHAIDRNALCNELSGGEWMRVRLARVLDTGFVILDEPTNDLDREGRQAVFEVLEQHSGGALVISHDRECLERCTEIFELSNRGLERFGGGWSAYAVARERERERLQHTLEQAKREREAAITQRHERTAKQERRNRQGAAVAQRGGAPKILLGGRKRRAQATSGKIDTETLRSADDAIRHAHEALTRLKVDPVMYADLLGESIPEQKLVAEALDFNIRRGDWLYRSDLNFAWRGNVRLAVRGKNGSGKSTLIKALRGEPLDTRGELRRGFLTTLYIDQRCGLLDENASVLDNVRATATVSDSELRNALARFLFAKEDVHRKVRDLSGGERLRAALAQGCLAAEKPQFLILDEPTNNLDLVNIEFLEQLVAQFRGAVLLVSHDERFLQNCNIQGELVL